MPPKEIKKMLKVSKHDGYYLKDESPVVNSCKVIVGHTNIVYNYQTTLL